MTIATTCPRTLLRTPRTDDMRSMLEDMEAASARLVEDYLLTPRPVRTVRPTPAPPLSPAPSPPPGPNFATQAVGTLVGTVTGLAVGAHRVLLGGCAGGAQGVVTASGADSDKVFQATLAVNLAARALAGELIGGVAGVSTAVLAFPEHYHGISTGLNRLYADS